LGEYQGYGVFELKMAFVNLYEDTNLLNEKKLTKSEELS